MLARRPARSGRTFARVVGFDLACPNCGTVDCVRASGLPWWKGTTRFNWWRSRWRCHVCRRVFAIGLAIWPVRRAGNRPHNGGQPIDTRPTSTQAEQLRELYGIVRRESRGWHDAVNVICTCADGDHAPDCPLSDDA